MSYERAGKGKAGARGEIFFAMLAVALLVEDFSSPPARNPAQGSFDKTFV